MNDQSTLEHLKQQIAALEEQLRQSQKMAAIGTLAGGIAHDFNNILSGILGFAELARLRIDPEQKDLEDNIDNVIRAGKRGQKLVEQILAVARSAGNEHRPIHIRPIISETLSLMKASFPSTISIRCHINAPRDVVMGDPTQIHQVFMNLCTNSFHAMKQRCGEMEVRLENINLTEKKITPWSVIKPGDYIRLSVKDTGHGMEPQVLSRIFEPYFTTKKQDSGTGLGLSIVYGIVKAHQGGIDAASVPGEGSTFTVFYPVIDHCVGDEDHPRLPVSRGKERILFIDDESFLVELAKGIFTHLGYTVRAEQNVLKALEVFRASPEAYDLVITDLTMPYMTGDKLAQEIKTIRPDIPVILCTGLSSRIDEGQIMEMAVDALLYKPLELTKLAKAIRDVLDDRISSKGATIKERYECR